MSRLGTRLTTVAHRHPFLIAFLTMGLVVSVGFYRTQQIIDRQAADEQCLRSVVIANSQRSSVLSRLSQQRSDADLATRLWTRRQNEAFSDALHGVNQRKVRREFAYANRHYLRAESRWERLNARYNRAAAAHPVPKLNCNAPRFAQPTATVTASTTATRTATAARTRTIPGPPGSTRTITRTVVEPPGKHRGRQR